MGISGLAGARRRRWFTLVAVTGIVVVAYTSGASTREPVDPPQAAAQVVPAVSATPAADPTTTPTAPPTPTLAATAMPAVESTPAPSPAPTPTASPALTATPSPPPPDPVTIGFASGYRGEGADARLVETTSVFDSGSRIAWRMATTQVVAAEEVRVTFTATADGRVVREFILDSPPDDRVFYGESLYVKRPGRYVMRTYADGLLIRRGSLPRRSGA